jgi:hypothetical protein
MSGLTMRVMLAALLTPVLVLGALLAGLLLWRRWRRPPKASP